MIMERMYGLDWPMQPASSSAGDDEAGKSRIESAGNRLFDRFETMLIFRTREDADSALAGMAEEWRETAEPLELLMVPDGAERSPFDRYGDFAFHGTNGTAYFDAREVAVFRLRASKPEAEPAPALMQLDEHLIAAIGAEGSAKGSGAWHVIERQLDELAERVARAYRCEIEWLGISRP